MGRLSLTLVVLAALVAGGVRAQESASYKIRDATINSASQPDEAGLGLSSSSFEISLASIGEPDPGTAMQSASWTAAGGFVSQYAPPAEIDGLRFTSQTTLVWDPHLSADYYNVYREEISQLTSLQYGDCVMSPVNAAGTTDTDPVPAGDGYAYLVTTVNALGEEGSKGTDSAGVRRPNPNPCP